MLIMTVTLIRPGIDMSHGSQSSTKINMSVIPAKVGIQMVNVTGCRIKSGMTTINARGHFWVNDERETNLYNDPKQFLISIEHIQA